MSRDKVRTNSGPHSALAGGGGGGGNDQSVR